MLKITNYCKFRDHCHYTGKYRGTAHSICNLKYSVPKQSTIAFHNGSNYDYHFIIKELAEEFEKQFIYLGENTEKYVSFSVPVEKEVTKVDTRITRKTISYRLPFTDSVRFMASSLSSLVNNLPEGIHKIKCKYKHDDKKCGTCGIK